MKPILDEARPFNTGDREWASEPDALEAINLSNDLAKAGNYVGALAILDSAIQQAEQNPYLYYNAGHWLSIQAKFEEACLSFEKSLLLDDKSSTIFCSYAYSLARSGRHAEAIAAYERALTLDPSEGSTHFLKAASLLVTGDFEAALSEVEKGKGLGATPQGKLIREVLIADDNG